jgi:hypothetical protein
MADGIIGFTIAQMRWANDNAAIVAGRISRRGFVAGSAFMAVAAVSAAPLLWLNAPRSSRPPEDAFVEALEADMQKLFKAEINVVMEVHGPTLHAVVINSRFNDLSDAQRAISAREIARFMMWNYGGPSRVRGFIVEFAKTNVLGVYDVNEADWHSFTRFHLR